MLTPIYKNKFEQDLKRALKRGKNAEKLKSIIRELVAGKKLAPKFREHKLVGNYRDRYECHIEPDWLLVYKRTETEIVFERTGSHSDLFD